MSKQEQGRRRAAVEVARAQAIAPRTGPRKSRTKRVFVFEHSKGRTFAENGRRYRAFPSDSPLIPWLNEQGCRKVAEHGPRKGLTFTG